MSTAIVTASTLNVRAKPEGAVLGVVKKGTVIEVREDHGDWLEVIANGTRGFVKETYVRRQEAGVAAPAAPAAATAPAVASVLPPEAAEADLRVDTAKGQLLGPGGIVVGKLYKAGLYNRGRTGIAAFLQSHQALFAQVSQSLVRTMSAVSENEGALEAVNTWDDCFLSFGSLQWTAGSGNAAGELGGLLARLQTAYSETFGTHFGRFGLSAAAPSPNPFALDYSHLKLNGRALDTAQAKTVLRQPIWAYRFWRAGHDEAVCRCQIEHAIARLQVFYRRAQSALGGRSAADLVSSEFGVALLFDQHVNRPGHVPGTLAQAFTRCVAEQRLSADASQWDSAQEAILLQRYLELRHATNMTDSRGRAERLRSAVLAGRLSDARGSFTM